MGEEECGGKDGGGRQKAFLLWAPGNSSCAYHIPVLEGFDMTLCRPVIKNRGSCRRREEIDAISARQPRPWAAS